MFLGQQDWAGRWWMRLIQWKKKMHPWEGSSAQNKATASNKNVLSNCHVPAVGPHSGWGDRKKANAYMTKSWVLVPGEGWTEQTASRAHWQFARSSSVAGLGSVLRPTAQSLGLQHLLVIFWPINSLSVDFFLCNFHEDIRREKSTYQKCTLQGIFQTEHTM